MRTTRLMLLIIALAVLCPPIPSIAKSKQVAQQGKTDDVVVTKNADGTVEAGDAPAQSAPANTHTIYYKAAPPATIRYGDGVVVRRNADGSVDVGDDDGGKPQFHSFGQAVAPRRVVKKKRATVKAAAQQRK